MFFLRSSFLTVACAFAGFVSAPIAPGAEIFTPEQIHHFETKVRPLLAENCYSCHGPQKQKLAGEKECNLVFFQLRRLKRSDRNETRLCF